MIRCPQCQKGLLWGVYLDIPPEMKSGEAEWLACEAPESKSEVTCPACQQNAGVYADLYAADADNRKLQRASWSEELREQTKIMEFPSVLVLGCEWSGNHLREGFLKDNWGAFSGWVDRLRDDKILPRRFSELPEMYAGSVGVWLEDPDDGGGRYVAGIVVPEVLREKIEARLQEPEYNDLKNARLIAIEGGFFAQLPAESDVKSLQKIHRFLKKDWLAEEPYELRQAGFLEIYPELLSSWPPTTPFSFCTPIAPQLQEEEGHEEHHAEPAHEADEHREEL